MQERIIRDFPQISWALNDYVRKDKEPYLLGPTNEAQDVINTLKSMLVEAPVLADPRPHRPYIIDTDSHAYELVAILHQTQTNSYLKQ